MTDAVAIAIVGGLTSCVGAYFAYKAKVQAEEAKAQAKETHLLVNSRMDELLDLSKKSAKAEGKLEEKQDEKARVADLDKSSSGGLGSA